jgi:hypothetical protein
VTGSITEAVVEQLRRLERERPPAKAVKLTARTLGSKS